MLPANKNFYWKKAKQHPVILNAMVVLWVGQRIVYPTKAGSILVHGANFIVREQAWCRRFAVNEE